MKKQELKDYIRNKLKTNNKWAIHGLEVIYQRQTPVEQSAEKTIEYNEIGFSGCDAEILTSFYKQYEKKNWLSEKQLALLKKRISRYAGQIYELSDKNKLAECYTRDSNQMEMKI